jgi:hypothetical protein
MGVAGRARGQIRDPCPHRRGRVEFDRRQRVQPPGDVVTLVAPVGHVEDRADEPAGPSVRVAFDAAHPVGEPHDRAVGVDHAVLADPVRAGAPGVLDGRLDPDAVVGVDRVEPPARLRQQRRFGHPEVGPELRAHVHHARRRLVLVAELEAVERGGPHVEELRELSGRALGGRFRLALRGDVHHHALEQQRLARVVAHHKRGAVDHPHDAAVAREVPVLHLERHALVDARLRGFLDAEAIVRMDPVSPVRVVPFLGCVPEHDRDLLADVREPLAVVTRACLPEVDHGGHVLEEPPEAARRAIPLALGALALGDLEPHRLVRLLELGGPRAHAELQLVVGALDRLLRFLLGGDVDHHALPLQRVAVRITHQGRVVADPHDLAVCADQPVLAAPRIAGGRVQIVRRQLDLSVVGVQDLHPHVLLVEPFLHRVAEQVLDLAVHVARAPVVVGDHLVDDRREVLEQRRVPGRRHLHGLLRVDPRRDVLEHALPDTLAGRAVGDRHRAVVYPHDASVGMDEAVLHVERFPGRTGLGVARLHRRHVVGMHQRRPVLADREEHARPVAEHVLHVGAHVARSGDGDVIRCDVDHHGEVFHDLPVGHVRVGGGLRHRVARVSASGPREKTPGHPLTGSVNIAQHYVDGDQYIFDRNSRTAAGMTQGCSDLDPVTSCRLFLITVDGRQATTDWSAGLGVVVLAGLAATPAPAASNVSKYSLTSNVQLITTRIETKIVEERVLKVTPSATSVPDIVPTSSAYPMFDLTSTMTANAGALAAINGDFGTAKDQPTHTLMIDGELWTTGDTRGNAIGWNEQGATFVAVRRRFGSACRDPRVPTCSM